MGGLERGVERMRDKGTDRQSESAKFRQTHLQRALGAERRSGED